MGGFLRARGVGRIPPRPPTPKHSDVFGMTAEPQVRIYLRSGVWHPAGLLVVLSVLVRQRLVEDLYH